MKYTDDDLSAYLDGELTGEKAAALDEALARDPGLRARLDALRRSNDAVRDAYDTIASQPIPARLSSLFERDASPAGQVNDNVVSLSKKGRAGSFFSPQSAIAASIALAIGVGVGNLDFAPGRDGGPAAPQTAALAAVIAPGDPLFDMLESTPSGDGVSLGRVGSLAATPILSFQSVDDRLCREFAVFSENAGLRAVACRTDSAWETMIAARADAPGPNGAHFRPAAASDPAIDHYLDKAMAGDALDLESERKFIESGWRPQGL